MSQNAKDLLAGQLELWTVVGPIGSQVGAEDGFFRLELDGAKVVPASFAFGGQPLQVRKAYARSGRVDFREIFGLMPGRPQAYAFCELDVPADCQARIVYDADWQAKWWLDGQEVHSTPDGNYGPVGLMRHPMDIGLTRGRHTLAVRVISGQLGWAFIVQLAQWQRGIHGWLDTSRDADWRDYTRTVVRYENRLEPDGRELAAPRESYEKILGSLGVEARWISTVEKTQGSYYPSRFLPSWPGARPEFERQIREWVEILHRNRIAAISWFPLCYCRAAAEQHPDWRQQYLVGPDPQHNHSLVACCINSPYGQAVIDYVTESLVKFDLDGLYFDGAAFTPIWERPQPVSCVCPHCRELFRKDTGLDLPAAYDWSSEPFRRWVRWRFDMFSRYWQRLTDGIHAAVPQAAVVFNHYHRERIGWCGAVPLNPFGHGFIAGTEADAEPLRGMFYTRAMRAYGRGHTEVWMHVCPGGRKYTPRGPELNPKPVLEFAAACATAGGHVATGGNEAGSEIPVLGRLADELKPRAPYLGLPSLPYLALHVSQQTETFVFGRNPRYLETDWTDCYWNSLTGWHNALAFAGKFCDVVYDDHLAGSLRKYPVLIMPLPMALTEAQFDVLLRYVRGGGSLVCGPWMGVCDEFGEPRKTPLGDLLGANGRNRLTRARGLPNPCPGLHQKLFPFGSTMPSWDQLLHRPQIEFSTGAAVKRRSRATLAESPMSASPLSFLPQGAGITMSLAWKARNPVFRRTKVGRGQVIQLAVDLGTLFRYSQSPYGVRAIADLFDFLPKPPVEVVSGDSTLLIGAFAKGKDVVVNVQPFAPPWETRAAAIGSRPWNAWVFWRGRKPKSARCVFPELGAELKIAKQGTAWRIQLPPSVGGQTVLLENVTRP
jgi:hypothetical protein